MVGFPAVGKARKLRELRKLGKQGVPSRVLDMVPTGLQVQNVWHL